MTDEYALAAPANVRDDLVLGLRAFTVGNYVIYFRSERGGIRVERVLHGAQDVDALIFE